MRFVMNVSNFNESFVFASTLSGNPPNSSRLPLSLVPVASDWQLVPILTLIFLIAAFVLNILFLGLIFAHSHLQTPFTTYIVNLLVANVVNQVYQQVLEVVAEVRTFAELGRAFCAAYLYGSYIVHAAVYNSHFLIALNRVWAVTFPITYRHYHTKRVSVFVCCLLWVYIHAAILPGFVRNELHHTSPLTGGCFLEYQTIWTPFDQIALFDVPLIVLFLAYPVICVCEVARSVKRRQRIAQCLENREQRQGAATVGSSTVKEAAPDFKPTLGERHNETTMGTSHKQNRSRKSWAVFNMLTLLTVSNFIFLLPLTLVYNLASFAEIITPSLWAEVAVMLLYVQAISDPILFTFALKDIREAFLAQIGWTRR